MNVNDIIQYAALAFLLYFLYNMFFAGDSAEDIRKALKDPRVVLLDTRSAGEFNSNGIPKSINIPHSYVKEKAAMLPKDKSAPIIAYCASGNRVKSALSSLKELGYTNVLNGVSVGKVAGHVQAVEQGQ